MILDFFEQINLSLDFFISERWKRLSGVMVDSLECSRSLILGCPGVHGRRDDKVIREETSAGPESDLCGPGLKQSNHNKGLTDGRDPQSVSSPFSRKLQVIFRNIRKSVKSGNFLATLTFVDSSVF